MTQVSPIPPASGPGGVVPHRDRPAAARGHGHAACWFRLRNGEKALLYLTDRARVVYLPTRDGYSVLVSSHAPERLLSALRDAAGEGGAGHPREEPDTGTRGDRPT